MTDVSRLDTSPQAAAFRGLDLDNLDLSRLDDEGLAALDDVVDYAGKHPLAWYWQYGQSKAQRELHNLRTHHRLCRSANSTGKTYAANAEAVSWCRGTHPHNDYWQVPCPCRVLYVVADMVSSYASDVCRTFQMLIRPEELSTNCAYDPVRGYSTSGRRVIEFINGSVIEFRSGHPTSAKSMSIEGVKVDVVVINEPPMETVFGAALARSPGGHCLMVFTPKPGLDLSWLRKYVEESDASELWGQTTIQFEADNVPWLDPKEVELMIKQTPSWEYDQRILGSWDAPALGRIYQGFSKETIVSTWPQHDVSIGLGLDHGERPGSQAAVIIAAWIDKYEARHAMIMREYVAPGRTTPTQDALNIVGILEVLGLSIWDISWATGDTNSAGKGSLLSVNQEFEEAFAAIGRKGYCPFHIHGARKAKGSSLRQARTLDVAFLEGRLTVHDSCEGLIKSYRHWRGTKIGQDETYTHLLDSARYALADYYDDLHGMTGRIERN